MREGLKRWRLPLIALALTLPLALYDPLRGGRAAYLLGENILMVMGIIPPVFVLLGLFDVWISRERVAPHLGESSGLRGVILSLLLGSSSAGPLYIAFPIAEVMIRKGASLRNIFIFIGAWSTMRIPMALFEISNLGFAFGLSRYAVSLTGVVLMALALDFLLKPDERQALLTRYREE
ncbi:permease [Aminivibrio sp.]